MKNPLMYLLYLLFPVAITMIASGFGNIFITIGAFVVSLLILAFWFRADLLMLLGMTKYQKNKAQGINLMTHAVNTGKLRPKSCLLYAYVLLRNGEPDEAESIINKTTYLGKGILKDAEKKNAELNLALIDWKRGNLNNAIMKAEQLYSDGYLNGNLYGTLGYFYIANNEIDKALEISHEAVEYNPDDLISLDNLGLACLLNGQIDEAEEIYEKIMEKEPKFLEPYYNYAMLFEKRAELNTAAEYYEKALNFEEKYLSTVTHEQVRNAIERLREIMR